MKSHLFLSLGLCLVVSHSFAANTITLQEALNSGAVSIDQIYSLGGHTGQNMEFVITNTTNKTIDLSINSGWLFEPADEGLQTMMLVQHKNVVIEKQGKRKTKVYTLCTEAHDGSPSDEDGFAMTKRSTGKLEKIATYLADKSYYNDEAAQPAVWVVSNNHQLSAVFSSNKTIQKDLVKYVADLTGQDVPWYNVKHTIQPGTPPIPQYIEAGFEFELPEAQDLTFGVYDMYGKAMKLIIEDKPLRKGHYRFKLEMEVFHLEPGIYYARAHSGNKTWKERMILIKKEDADD